MSTLLSKQLKQLGLSEGFEVQRRLKGTPSLIFAPKEASKLSAQEVYDACIGGFEELCAKESRFEQFKSTLFYGVPKEREQRTKKENEKVNKSVETFLKLVVDYFLTPAAFKALEHLVRSYKINECNIGALLGCCLPYHATREFQQVVRVIPLEGTMWHWMRGLQSSGLPLPREALVTRCTKDLAVLSFIGDMAQWSADPKFANSRVFPFYTTLMCEVIQQVKEMTEELMLCLLKYILGGLGDGSPSDLRSGTLMIVVKLCEKAALAEKLINVLVEKVLLASPAEELDQALIVVCTIYRTQEQQVDMADAVFKLLLKMEVAEPLGRLCDGGLDIQRMLTLLLEKLLPRIGGKKRSCVGVLCDLISHVPMHQHVDNIFVQMLDKGVSLGPGDTEKREAVQKVVRCLDLHFPEDVDKAINRNLASNLEKVETKRKKKKKEEDVAGEQNRHRVEFLQGCLTGGLYQSVSQDSSQMLLLAVDAPAARMRKEALAQLNEILNTGSCSDYIMNFAVNAVLRRLGDDDMEVVGEALQSPCLVKIPEKDLLQALKSVVDRSAMSVWSGDNAEDSAISVAVRSVETLGRDFLKSFPDKAEEVFKFLFEYILSPGAHAASTLSRTVIKVLQHLDHPLAGIVALCDVVELETDTNKVVIETMAKQPVPKVSDILPKMGTRGQHLLLLVLNHACAGLKGGELKGVIQDAWHAVQSLWDVLSESGDCGMEMDTDPAPNPAVQALTAGPIPTTEHFTMLREAPLLARKIALRTVLLSCLSSMRTAGDGVIAVKDLEDLFVKMIVLNREVEFGSHIGVLLEVVESHGMSRWEFLSGVFGLPPGEGQEEVVVNALRIACQELRKMADGQGGQGALSTLVSVAPHVLGCLARPEKAIRENGLLCIDALLGGLTLSSEEDLHIGEVRDALVALFKVFQSYKGSIKSDSTACLMFLTKLLASNPVSLPNASKDAQPVVELTQHSCRTLCQYFLAALPSLTGPAKAQGALLVVRTLAHSAEPHVLYSHAQGLLNQLFGAELDAKGRAALCDLACKVLSLCTREVVHELMQKKAAERKVAFDMFVRILDASWDRLGAMSAVRASAAKCVTKEWLGHLPVGVAARDDVLHALLVCASSDTDLEVRDAARQALEAVELHAEDFLPLLRVPECELEASPSKKRLKGVETAVSTGQARVSDSVQLSNCLRALELLQWKSGVQGEHKLVSVLQDVLEKLQEWVKRELHEEDAASGKDSVAYIARIALLTLKDILLRMDQKDHLGLVKVELVVEYVKHSNDGPLRNAGLSLLSVIADCLPHQTLSHVLEILKLMGSREILQSDGHSQQLAQHTLSVIVPAWLKGGEGPKPLWETCVGMLPAIHPQNRVSILTSLLRAMSEAEGLASALLVMLRMDLDHEGAVPSKFENSEVSGSWMLLLAQQLCKEVSSSCRALAFAKCMQESVAEAGGVVHAPFPRAIVQFVLDNLELLPHSDVFSMEGASASLVASKGCGLILQQAVAQLSALSAGDGRSDSIKSHGGIQASRKSLLAVTEALKGVMDVYTYIKCIVQFVGSDSDSIIRHGLRLYGEKIKEMEMQGIDWYGSDYMDKMAPVALSICQPVKTLLGSKQTAEVSKQLGLVCIQSAANVFGSQHPEEFIELLETIVGLVDSEDVAVKGSALATMAAVVRGLGEEAVAVLPQFVPAVLRAIKASLGALSGRNPDPPGHDGQGNMDVDEEATALHLASGLAVVQSLVECLGKFLSPYLAEILELVLTPEALNSSEESVVLVAQAICEKLPDTVPIRLLMDPLFGTFDSAVGRGEQATVHLLQIVGSMARKLKRESVPTYHEQIFVFLLRALDLRHQGQLQMSSLRRVDDASMNAFLCLVMKLNEAQFKPLFLRVLEWSGCKEEASGTELLGRQTVFYHLVGALAHKLRSVFVGYFNYFLKNASAILLATQSETKTKKKKKRSRAGEEQEGPLETQQNLYLLRLHIVRALHRCFVYDTAGFMTQDIFDAILPSLIHQLKCGGTAEGVLDGLDLSLDPELDGGLSLFGDRRGVDVLGVSLVGCLVELAVMNGLESMWQPLNQQVLKTLRKGSHCTRVLCLEVIWELVKRLKEEYVPLVPEALPKLAEVLEDTNVDVSNRARDIIGEFEKVSGDSYEQYLK